MKISRTSMLTSPKAAKDWTLMFYNVGSRDESLMTTAIVKDLESVGSDSHTNVVVKNYRSTWLPEKLLLREKPYLGSTTYYVEKTRDREPLGEVAAAIGFFATSAGDLESPVLDRNDGAGISTPESLKSFVLDTMRSFPARRYALILSGHGGGPSGQLYSHDPEKSWLSNDELGQVLCEVARENGGRKLDLVNLNTCYGAGLETVLPLAGGAQALVASQSSVYGATQPFGAVLESLQRRLSQGVDVPAADLASMCVREAKNQTLSQAYTPTLSAFDTAKVPGLRAAVVSLQKAIMAQGVSVAEVVDGSQTIPYGKERLVDLGSLSRELLRRYPEGPVAEHAHAVLRALEETVIAEQHAKKGSGSWVSTGFLAFSGHRRHDFDDVSGLSIYYHDGPTVPDVIASKAGRALQSEEFLTYLARSQGAASQPNQEK